MATKAWPHVSARQLALIVVALAFIAKAVVELRSLIVDGPCSDCLSLNGFVG